MRGGDSESEFRQATVSVGSETITLPVSEDYVRRHNEMGDALHYGRDEITDLSYYWVGTETLEFAPGRGYLISTYAAEALRKLIREGRGDLAYEIAQESFERSQQKGWPSTDHKLVYPLKFW